MLTDNFGSQSFNYYYDTQNRRVRKQYPNGDIEGYFWSTDRRLLMETAPENAQAAPQVMDEYLWLGQRPLLMLRSSYLVSNGQWTRDRPDWDSGWCVRRGEAIQCRPYGIVSDYLGKPVLTVDSSQLVSGVLEYDPYGVVNRTSHWGEVAPAGNGCAWVTYGMSQGTSPLLVSMRTHAPRVDIGASGCIGQYSGYPETQRDIACGPRWNYWSPWESIANGSSMHLLYCSNSNGTPNPQPFGVSVDGYEYKRYETGATPYIPPFRFPGQYFDPETDLNENWNRYYEPTSGRYLSPEPLLQSAKWVAAQLRLGRQVPSYSYALNNPLRNSDPTGLFVPEGFSPQQLAAFNRSIQELRRNLEGTSVYRAPGTRQRSRWEGVSYGGDVCRSRFRSLGQDVDGLLTNGSGPIVRLDPFTPLNGYVNPFDGTIYLNPARGIDANVIIHEAGHWADLTRSGWFNMLMQGSHATEVCAVGTEVACLGRSGASGF